MFSSRGTYCALTWKIQIHIVVSFRVIFAVRLLCYRNTVNNLLAFLPWIIIFFDFHHQRVLLFRFSSLLEEANLRKAILSLVLSTLQLEHLGTVIVKTSRREILFYTFLQFMLESLIQWAAIYFCFKLIHYVFI